MDIPKNTDMKISVAAKRGSGFRALACAVLVLAAAMTFSACGNAGGSGQKLSDAAELKEKIAPLEKEEQMLKQEISRRKREEGLITGKSGVGELIVLGADQEFLTGVVPMIRQYHAPGATFAFSDTDFPGLPGKISPEEFRELKDAGWSACLYWDGTAELSSWLPEMEARFQEIGEPMPEALVFAEGAYTPELDPILLESGIRIAVHHGESGLPILCNDEPGSELWHPGACGYYDMVGRQKPDYLEQAENSHTNVIYTVCMPEEGEGTDAAAESNVSDSSEEATAQDAEPEPTEDAGAEGADAEGEVSRIYEAGSAYENHPFAQFLGYWGQDTTDKSLTPKGLYEARDYLYRCSIPEADAELLDDEIRAKRERIDEIHKEIDALYDEYYGKN